MSSRYSAQINGAPSGIRAIHADRFARRGSDSVPTSLGRMQTQAAVQKPFRLTREGQSLLERDICLEQSHMEDVRNVSHIRILSIDHYPVVREGIGAIINSQRDML